MASPSGASSGSSLIQNSGSDEDLRAVMDQRKRKRMISNRESARRSRMRKQKHLDDLTAQVAQLKEENRQILATINITTQQFLRVEADNSILRAQVGELSHRLESLNDIIGFLSNGNGNLGDSNWHDPAADSFLSQMNMAHLNQPLMASPGVFHY